MNIKGREIIFIISDISESLYKITKLTEDKAKYNKKEVNRIYEEILIIDKYIGDIKNFLVKLSNNL